VPGTTELNINGKRFTVESDPPRSLLTVLRDELHLTGAKYGCGEGECGACTVVLGENAARACVIPLATVAGKPIRTVEGLAGDGPLTPLQKAFLDAGAFQCGFCTSGMLMSATVLLQKNKKPSDEDILRAMQGNICRCGMFRRIAVAIRTAAEAKA
jgi:aerobic-type carbon monoxide dehydrogenase small subunit (CoxS/CutS family)